MKKTILSLLITVGLIGGSSAAVIFQDEFSGTSIDTSLWEVTNLGGGYLTQESGKVTFNHPNYWDGVFITTKQDFFAPYRIDSSFLLDPDYPISVITLRSSGQYGGYYNDPYGLQIGIYFGTSANIVHFTPEINTSLVDFSAVFNPNQWNTFSIYDYGDSISVSINNTLVLDRFAVSPEIGFGNKVSFTDSDNGNYNGDINASSIGPVTISSIPEPSTYALFGIGAIGMLIVMRRKKTV